MNNKKNLLEVRTLALIGIMTGLIIIMTMIPFLGFIPVGPIQATTLHIPVIIVGIVEGPLAGGILGFMFGVISMIRAIVQPNPFSFMFMNPIIAIIPRILIGVFAGLVYKALRDKKAIGKASITISAAIGSLTNTIFVLGLIYLIYGQQYMETVNKVKNQANTSAIKLIAATALSSGLVEMAVAAVIATPICMALIRAFKKRRIA